MTQTPDDRTPFAPREDRPPIAPSTKRAMWPWMVGGSVLLLVVIVLAVFLLTPPSGMVQIP